MNAILSSGTSGWRCLFLFFLLSSSSSSFASAAALHPLSGGRPTQMEIQRSLRAISFNQPIKRKDFNNATWAFINNGRNRHQYTIQWMHQNKYLAETWLLYSSQLRFASSRPGGLEGVMDQMFRHYIINTNGPIPERAEEVRSSGPEDHFDVYNEGKAYAKMLNVRVDTNIQGSPVLIFNGRSILCPDLTLTPGKTAAYSLRKAGPLINRTRYGRDDVLPSFVFGFDENAKKYSLENAMIMADFSHLAYLEPDYIRDQLNIWGYKDFEWFEDKNTDTQSFLAVKNNHVVACFRGTGSTTDWMTDLNLLFTTSNSNRGNVHAGFKAALDGVWSRMSLRLRQYGAEGKRLFFTGHSLGAALAQMAAFRHGVNQAGQIGGVFIYGSPRVGNQSFKSSYDGILFDKTFLHINNKDLVPQIPFRLLGYRHLGPNPMKFDARHGLSTPGDEDPIRLREFNSLAELDPQTKRLALSMMRAAGHSIQNSDKFLRTNPRQMERVTYGTSFESGKVDDHGMDQYLFKLGCAIVDRKYSRMQSGQ